MLSNTENCKVSYSPVVAAFPRHRNSLKTSTHLTTSEVYPRVSPHENACSREVLSAQPSCTQCRTSAPWPPWIYLTFRSRVLFLAWEVRIFFSRCFYYTYIRVRSLTRTGMSSLVPQPADIRARCNLITEAR